MCGRFAHISYLDNLRETFEVEEAAEDVRPNYNAAPTQPVPVVVEHGVRRLALFRWGLVPSWAKDLSMGARLINAREETVTEKPAFRAAAVRRRCLVAADGYYEWRAGPESKEPWFLYPESGTPFGFAGLWEQWQPREGGEPVLSCTIITAEATGFAATVHHRMPVILAPAAWEAWLSPEVSAKEDVRRMLREHKVSRLAGHRVSTRVNSVKNNEPGLVRPVDA